MKPSFVFVSIISQNILNSFAKVRKIEKLLLPLCQVLTKVESRHDSANHASMFLDEPSGKAERVLAAPRLENY
jgi:hypothetical protein